MNTESESSFVRGAAWAGTVAALRRARQRRVGLARRGRWAESERLAAFAVDLAFARLTGDRSGIGDFVYVAGGFQPGAQGRLAAGAIQAANRGVDRAAALRDARLLLDSAGWRDAGAFWQATLTLVYAGELGQAEQQCSRAGAAPGWLATQRHRSVLTLLNARLAWLGGDPATAARLLEPVVQNPAGERTRGLAVAWLIAALADLNQIEQAHDLLLGHGYGGDLADVPEQPELLAARGALHFAVERFALAGDDFLAAGRSLAARCVSNPAILPWQFGAALCAHAQGRSTLAGAIAREASAAAHRWGSSRSVGVAEHAVALVSGGDLRLLHEAHHLLSAGGPSAELLRVRYDLALACASLAKDTRTASRLLTATRDEAAAAGYSNLAHRCRSALERIAQPAGLGELTRQERKIAALARAGRSNRQIAKYQLLAVRTVESHLSSVYRKLGIAGRHELTSMPFALS